METDRHAIIQSQLEQGAQRELNNYRAQQERERKANQPSDAQIEQMRALLDKLKGEGIEAKGAVGFVTCLTTPQWIILMQGTGNQEGRGTIFSYRNPERIVSNGDTPIFSEKDVLLIHELVLDPTFNYVRFKDVARIISYREESLPPTVKLSSVELCEMELRKCISGDPQTLNQILNPQKDHPITLRTSMRQRGDA